MISIKILATSFEVVENNFLYNKITQFSVKC